MRAEIIAVGTELLLGQIVNTNAQFLSQALNDLGVDVYFHTVVGDNSRRMLEAFRIAADRSELVIITGGLGPTQDDITKEMLGEFTGRALQMDGQAMRKITDFFAERGLQMSDNNARQALTLSGSTVLPNDNGLAVGVALTEGGVHWLVLPGPPRELKTMFMRYGVPWIRSQLGLLQPLFSTTLKFAGIGESGLEKRLADLIAKQQDPTIAPYAKDGEVALRLSTKAVSQAEADRKMAPLLAEIKKRVGRYLYASRDIPLEEVVLERLRKANQTLAVAESCTGGLLGELITSIPGSSQVLTGGVISYSAKAKVEQLGVSEQTISQHGTISAQTAEQMAEGCRRIFASDWALSVTGVAGPHESEGKKPGTVFAAIAGSDGVESYALQLSGDRDMIRLRAAKAILYRLWQKIRGDSDKSKR